MKIWSRVVTAIICVAVVGGCGYFSSKPSDVVTSYIRHVERGEIEEAAKLYSNALVSREGGMTKVKDDLSNVCRELKAKGGFKSFEVTKEEVFGDLADVSTKVAVQGGEERTATIKLTKENGE